MTFFSVGFAFSATAALGALAVWVGEPLTSVLSREVRLGVLLGGLAVLLAVDLVRHRRGLSCSVGLRRQTPRILGFRPIGPLIWGLDTGLPMTTYRTTPLPMIGLLLVALGFGSPWIGAVYAAGFLGSLFVACYWPRSEDQVRGEAAIPGTPGSGSVIASMRAYTRPLWTAGLILGCTVALFTLAQLTVT